ncbi:hypothetical protein G7Z17_g6393 [Cylindrodendrum hubeiense]|uniref:Uncharacterized protein n=1 Tax=Cylindrodendrum hubeiense TaxID=595255 RepID=A0A9P5HA01_9HYPO|nr:hypothetical protein G7Z17_g6393 [Cylindrodendrum hubeiense]
MALAQTFDPGPKFPIGPRDHIQMHIPSRPGPIPAVARGPRAMLIPGAVHGGSTPCPPATWLGGPNFQCLPGSFARVTPFIGHANLH